MSAARETSEQEKPVEINRAFIRAAATNAALRFFRPITVVFEQTAPGRYVFRSLKADTDRH
jgi:hypothetical protein